MGRHARRTSPGVYAADRFAGAVITVGGFLVLAAVLGVCVYLFAVAAPLFREGRAEVVEGRASARGEVLAVEVDEYARGAAFLERDEQGAGVLRWVATVSDGELAARALTGGRVTAWSQAEHDEPRAIGFADGRVRLGRFGFSHELVRGEDVPEGARGLAPGERRVVERPGDAGAERVIAEHLGAGQSRLTSVFEEFGEALDVGKGAGAVTCVDVRSTSTGERYLAVLREDGTLVIATTRTVRPLGGGAARTRLETIEAALPPDPERGVPGWVFVTADGAQVLCVYRDGLCRRVSRTHVVEGKAAVVEEAALSGGRPISAARMLLGGLTLLTGGEDGVVLGHSVAADPGTSHADGMRLVPTRRYVGEGRVGALGISPRTRLVAVGGKGVGFVHMVSGKGIETPDVEEGGVKAGDGEAISALAFSPKGDALGVLRGRELELWSIDAGHIEASAASLFGRVIYEGSTRGEWVYQSSAADDAAELKMSLVPLIFGTLKATVVAMLIAVPLAVLAAVYTSEFLKPSVRRVVKPCVEMMASMPSVVLGFLAAIIVAPFVSAWLPEVALSLVMTPVGVLVLAHLWQVVPRSTRARMGSSGRLAATGLAVAASVGASVLLSPVVERALFRGDDRDARMAAGHYEVVPGERVASIVRERGLSDPGVRRELRKSGMFVRDGVVVRPVEGAAAGAAPGGLARWLEGEIGGAWPGWFVLLALPGVGAAWVAHGRREGRRRRDAGRVGAGWSERREAWAEFAKFCGVALAGLLGAAGVAWLIGLMGLDARDSILGTFQQRNTLVVGLIMGFAVIPIIYTISEDALRSVPEPLRSASLGVGATPWQTAVRVVLPAAGSGVFSACMIGLGRAVGETMIVLMATGNTPEMSLNLFSGLRTLAANIAVELPEAPQGGTHYRVLVLCGLVLFAMTFVINTTAEVVRQRVRKRTASL